MPDADAIAPVPDPLIAIVASLGPWGIVGALALKYGLPWVEHLIGNIQNNTPVTSEEWARLRAKNATGYDELPGGK